MSIVLLALLVAAGPNGEKKKKPVDDWLTIAPASNEKKKAPKKKQPPPALRAPQTAAGKKGDEPGRSSRPADVKHTPPAAAVKQQPPPQVAKPAQTSQPSKVSQAANGNITLQLAEAKTLFDNLEYDRVVPIAAAVLARPDANIDQRLDAYLLHGSSLAIIGDAVEAEKPFRFLLRGRPEFDMPPETSPKILSVFRKVQVEEKAIVAQMRELERVRMVKALQLSGDHPTRANGGRELEFEYPLKDPFGVVEEMKIAYRRRGEPSFSSLALKRDDVGVWRAALPPTWTASDAGFVLEYYLTTADARGSPLLTVADAQAPLTANIEPGVVEEGEELYEKPWFWVAAGATVVLSGVAGVVLYQRGSRLPETDLGEVRIR